MQISNPKIVFDPYEWLPSYGESRIELIYKSNELLLKIFYEIKGQSDEEFKKVIFLSPAFFHLAHSPGANALNFQYEKTQHFTCLLEYSDSQFANKWSEHFNQENIYKHYLFILEKSSKRLDVVAKSVLLVE